MEVNHREHKEHREKKIELLLFAILSNLIASVFSASSVVITLVCDHMPQP
jgi:hypothetical protein